MKSRESQLFVDNIGLLRKDCEAAEMVSSFIFMTEIIVTNR